MPAAALSRRRSAPAPGAPRSASPPRPGAPGCAGAGPPSCRGRKHCPKAVDLIIVHIDALGLTIDYILSERPRRSNELACILHYLSTYTELRHQQVMSFSRPPSIQSLAEARLLSSTSIGPCWLHHLK